MQIPHKDFFFFVILATTTILLIATTIASNMLKQKLLFASSQAKEVCNEGMRRCQPGEISKFTQFCRNGEWVNSEYCGECANCICEEDVKGPTCKNF